MPPHLPGQPIFPDRLSSGRLSAGKLVQAMMARHGHLQLSNLGEGAKTTDSVAGRTNSWSAAVAVGGSTSGGTAVAVGGSTSGGTVVPEGELLASVLAYLHDFSPPIVHRDIKLDNVCGAMSRDRQGAHMTHSFG